MLKYSIIIHTQYAQTFSGERWPRERSSNVIKVQAYLRTLMTLYCPQPPVMQNQMLMRIYVTIDTMYRVIFIHWWSWCCLIGYTYRGYKTWHRTV